MSANDTFEDKKVTEPIGSRQPTDKSHYQIPPWAEAGSVIISRPKPNLTVWKWFRNVLGEMLAHVPYNKVRKKCKEHFAFVCDECTQKGWMRFAFMDQNNAPVGSPGVSMAVRKNYFPIRCKSCNGTYRRYKRARKAMQKLHDRGMPIWFITLTRPNITGIDANSPFVQTADREMWVADFKKFRRRKIWKDTFAGGYWFYEFTTHAPGDKIFSKDGTFIRQVTEHEMNGHLHILATAEDRIPMKELRAAWGDRVDFSKPEKPNDVLRYLRGYLTKCDLAGINMRPFGDIHQSQQSSTDEEDPTHEQPPCIT